MLSTNILGTIAPDVLKEQVVRKSLGLDPTDAKPTEPSDGLGRSEANVETTTAQ